MRKPTLIFDMDGTLNICGPYYDETKLKGAREIAQLTGVTPEQARTLIEELDMIAVKTRPDAFRRDRFPRSFAAAYAACASILHGEILPDHLHRLFDIGDEVFDAPYALYEGAREALREFRARGWQLVIHTKGDDGVQRLKLDRNALWEEVDAVYIGLEKSVARLEQIVRESNVDIARSWMIGDSQKDDIFPAQQLGFKTALISDGTHYWAYNDAAIQKPTLEVSAVRDLVSLITLEPLDATETSTSLRATSGTTTEV